MEPQYIILQTRDDTLITVLSAFGASIVGGLIAGFFSYWGVRKTLQGQRQLDKDRQQEIKQGFLEAVYEELSALWNQINEEVGKDMERFKKRREEGIRSNLITPLSITQDYFAFYRSNTNLIVQIEDSGLRRNIVKVYMLLQVFIDEYGRNFRLLNESLAPIEEHVYIKLSSNLSDLGDKLRERHDDLEGLTGYIFRELREKYNIGNSAKDNT